MHIVRDTFQVPMNKKYNNIFNTAFYIMNTKFNVSRNKIKPNSL